MAGYGVCDLWVEKSKLDKFGFYHWTKHRDKLIFDIIFLHLKNDRKLGILTKIQSLKCKYN